MTDSAQEWLDNLTATINNEEEYLRRIYKARDGETLPEYFNARIQATCNEVRGYSPVGTWVDETYTFRTQELERQAWVRETENDECVVVEVSTATGHHVFHGGDLNNQVVNGPVSTTDVFQHAIMSPIDISRMYVPSAFELSYQIESYYRRTSTIYGQTWTHWIEGSLILRGERHLDHVLQEWVHNNPHLFRSEA